MRKNQKMSKKDRMKRSIASKAAHQRARDEGRRYAKPTRDGYSGFQEASKAAGLARSRRVRECYKVVIELITEWQAEGYTYCSIANRLNRQGFLTAGGNPFTEPAVCAVFKIFGVKPVKHLKKKWDTCIKCGEKFRIPKKELLDRHRLHVCFDCRGEK